MQVEVYNVDARSPGRATPTSAFMLRHPCKPSAGVMHDTANLLYVSFEESSVFGLVSMSPATSPPEQSSRSDRDQSTLGGGTNRFKQKKPKRCAEEG